MPKPRKTLRLTYRPPSTRGWYAYSHDGSPFQAIYLDEEGIENAVGRFLISQFVGLEPVDVWSTRRLKNRGRGAVQRPSEVRR